MVRASKLKPWNTNPIIWFRISARAFLSRLETSIPSSKYRPALAPAKSSSLWISSFENCVQLLLLKADSVCETKG